MPRCSQSNCRIAETGICLDGHKQGCPHLLPEELAVAASTDKAPQTNAAPDPEPYRFHSGEKLNISEASRLLNDRPSRVVLCAGSQRSGKTTFLARIGEMFRTGAFSQYRFAGSLTLCAFERLTWWATITSGAGNPDTPRTRRIENDTFLHLHVVHKENTVRNLNLLISDLAGETFSHAVAAQEFCADLRSLARADSLVLFLDCARLADPAQRHPEVNNALAFLQRVATVRAHDQKGLHVQVVFSRWDYITGNAKHIELGVFCQSTQDDFIHRFGSLFASISFKRIAARPKDGTSPTNDDIQALFADWLEAPLFAPTVAFHRNPNPSRDFSAFGLS